MTPIAVNIVSISEEGWLIHSDGRTPNQVKNLYLGKAVTNGEKIIVVTGISYRSNPVDSSEFVAVLMHDWEIPCVEQSLN